MPGIPAISVMQSVNKAIEDVPLGGMMINAAGESDRANTEYPHLIFPTLAQEKAEEVAAWQERTLAIRESLVQSAFAA